MAVGAHLMPSNVVFMPKIMIPITWSLVGRGSKY
jgi:hypothetical protein